MRHGNPTRVTRSFWTGIPRYRTNYERPVNWGLFKATDFALLIFTVVVGLWGVFGQVVQWVCVVWYIVVMPFVIHRRRVWREENVCAARGHHPWSPMPGLVECEFCGADLSDVRVGDPERVATSVAAAASEAELARRRQSYYSDRR